MNGEESIIKENKKITKITNVKDTQNVIKEENVLVEHI